MPKGDAGPAKAHREWLRNLPRLTGTPLTRIAQKSNVSPSTLTRFLQEGDDSAATLHARTIEKIVAAFGVEPPPGVGRPRPEGTRGTLREDAAAYSPEPGDALAAAVAALSGGSNTIAAFTLRSRAIELAGFVPGDVVLVDLADTAPKPGDVVCAQVYDWPRMQADTVMRVFERASPVDLLVTRTCDPALQTPLVVDGERVVIKGVLLPHRLRPVPKA